MEKEKEEEEERRRIPQEAAGREWMVRAFIKKFLQISNILYACTPLLSLFMGNLLRTYLLPAVRSNCSYAPK